MRYVVALMLTLALVALLTSPLGAIDKKPKSQPPAKPTPTQKINPAPSKAPDSTGNKKNAKVAPNNKQQKYNDFIDKNNNGIDDRLEDLKKKPDK
ncbi:MAG TPA: hypothetical protein VMS71_07495 [Candidatus Acidoferrum sp.]|nr:hypothetical protein [Candidatus Acidoferrum sp.]